MNGGVTAEIEQLQTSSPPGTGRLVTVWIRGDVPWLLGGGYGSHGYRVRLPRVLAEQLCDALRDEETEMTTP